MSNSVLRDYLNLKISKLAENGIHEAKLKSEILVQEGLESLMAERTCMIVAHRLSTVRSVDRIIVMKNGRIVESGTHEELYQKDSGVYKTLYDLQFGELS